jgi:hypothetical protein
MSQDVGCHRMSENSGVGLHKFHCIHNLFLKVDDYIECLSDTTNIRLIN